MKVILKRRGWRMAICAAVFFALLCPVRAAETMLAPYLSGHEIETVRFPAPSEVARDGGPALRVGAEQTGLLSSLLTPVDLSQGRRNATLYGGTWTPGGDFAVQLALAFSEIYATALAGVPEAPARAFCERKAGEAVFSVTSTGKLIYYVDNPADAQARRFIFLYDIGGRYFRIVDRDLLEIVLQSKKSRGMAEGMLLLLSRQLFYCSRYIKDRVPCLWVRRNLGSTVYDLSQRLIEMSRTRIHPERRNLDLSRRPVGGDLRKRPTTEDLNLTHFTDASGGTSVPWPLGGREELFSGDPARLLAAVSGAGYRIEVRVGDEARSEAKSWLNAGGTHWNLEIDGTARTAVFFVGRELFETLGVLLDPIGGPRALLAGCA